MPPTHCWRCEQPATPHPKTRLCPDCHQATTAEHPAWYADALCAQTDPEAFYPEKGGSTANAKRTCSACPVRAICRDTALARGEEHGIWGGTSTRERRAIRHALGITTTPPTHREITAAQ